MTKPRHGQTKAGAGGIGDSRKDEQPLFARCLWHAVGRGPMMRKRKLRRQEQSIRNIQQRNIRYWQPERNVDMKHLRHVPEEIPRQNAHSPQFNVHTPPAGEREFRQRRTRINPQAHTVQYSIDTTPSVVARSNMYTQHSVIVCITYRKVWVVESPHRLFRFCRRPTPPLAARILVSR